MADNTSTSTSKFKNNTSSKQFHQHLCDSVSIKEVTNKDGKTNYDVSVTDKATLNAALDHYIAVMKKAASNTDYDPFKEISKQDISALMLAIR